MISAGNTLEQDLTIPKLDVASQFDGANRFHYPVSLSPTHEHSSLHTPRPNLDGSLAIKFPLFLRPAGESGGCTIFPPLKPVSECPGRLRDGKLEQRDAWAAGLSQAVNCSCRGH